MRSSCIIMPPLPVDLEHSPMVLAEWIEMRSRRSAAIGVITELMNMHATLGRGVAAGNIVGDGRGRGLGGLLEGDGAADFGVAAEDGNCYGGGVLVMVGGRICRDG